MSDQRGGHSLLSKSVWRCGDAGYIRWLLGTVWRCVLTKKMVYYVVFRSTKGRKKYEKLNTSKKKEKWHMRGHDGVDYKDAVSWSIKVDR